MSTTVVVADARTAARRSAVDALSAADFDVVAEVSRAGDAVRYVRSLRPDVCTISLGIPGGARGAILQMRAFAPATAILTLSTGSDVAEVIRALADGARGCVLDEHLHPDSLAAAVRAAARGEAVVPRRLADALVEELRHRDRERCAPPQHDAEVSAREWEVLELLQQGLTTAQIARRLFVAPVTVRSHVASLLRKLGATSRDELANMSRG